MPPQRGDVYWAEIKQNETVGSEQYGYRPWLVVSSHAIHFDLPIVIVVALTTKEKPNPQHRIEIPEEYKVHEPGQKDWRGHSIALTEQIRVMAIDRLGGERAVRAGFIKPIGLNMVEAGIKHVLSLP